MVASHGTHQVDEIEIYKGKAIFYGLGELFFGREGDLLTRIPHYPKAKAPRSWRRRTFAASGSDAYPANSSFQVASRTSGAERWNVAGYQPALRRPAEVPESVDRLIALSSRFGTRLRVEDNDVTVIPD